MVNSYKSPQRVFHEVTHFEHRVDELAICDEWSMQEQCEWQSVSQSD